MKAEERGFHYENEQKWRSGVGYISLSVYLYLSLSAAIYQKIYLVVHPMVSAKIYFGLIMVVSIDYSTRVRDYCPPAAIFRHKYVCDTSLWPIMSTLCDTNDVTQDYVWHNCVPYYLVPHIVCHNCITISCDTRLCDTQLWAQYSVTQIVATIIVTTILFLTIVSNYVTYYCDHNCGELILWDSIVWHKYVITIVEHYYVSQYCGHNSESLLLSHNIIGTNSVPQLVTTIVVQYSATKLWEQYCGTL